MEGLIILVLVGVSIGSLFFSFKNKKNGECGCANCSCGGK